MFRSSTILRTLVQSLAKVTLQLNHSVKLLHFILCGDVAACRETACVLFVVQTIKVIKAFMLLSPYILNDYILLVLTNARIVY